MKKFDFQKNRQTHLLHDVDPQCLGRMFRVNSQPQVMIVGSGSASVEAEIAATVQRKLDAIVLVEPNPTEADLLEALRPLEIPKLDNTEIFGIKKP